MKAEWASYKLQFKFVARTSRDTMTEKQTYFVRLTDDDNPSRTAIGECALFRGLSADDVPDYETLLSKTCMDFGSLPRMSSIRFGFESAQSLLSGQYAGSSFMKGESGIPINGLIWMGDKGEMRRRIESKLESGYKVLKLKIGGINFEDELYLLQYIRSLYGCEELEIRCDANGSFSPGNALERLKRLSDYGIHSIEQPIKAGYHEDMWRLCRESPIPIALDEELIGVRTRDEKRSLIESIQPQYIILKPALCGGLRAADEWADLAESAGIGWWATSALESNIGLAAIAAWVSFRGVSMPQGLGTGQLYYNNVVSPLELVCDRLYYRQDADWIIPNLEWRR